MTNDEDLALLQSVAKKGEKLYQRTRNSASAESAKRAKSVSASQEFNSPNLLYDDEKTRADTAKEAMLKTISGFRPNETVFEVGKKGEISETAEIIKRRREKIRKTNAAKALHAEPDTEDLDNGNTSIMQASDSLSQEDEDEVEILEEEDNDDAASNPSDLDTAFPSSGGRANPYADPEFLTYAPRTSNAAEDRGYALDSSTNHSTAAHFSMAASSATMDLTADDNASFAMASRPSQMRWDKKAKNYVARTNDVDGSRGAKMVKGESGVKIAASFRSGRFEDWKRRNRIDRLPRVGDREKEGSGGRGGRGGARGGMGQGGSQVAVGRGSGKFMHHKEKEAKAPDKYRDDYFVKKRKLDEKRRGDAGDGEGAGDGAALGGGRGGAGGRGGRGSGRGGSGFGAAGGRGGRGGKPRSELRGVDDIRKQRVQKQQRRDKNARPPRRGRG